MTETVGKEKEMNQNDYNHTFPDSGNARQGAPAAGYPGTSPYSGYTYQQGYNPYPQGNEGAQGYPPVQGYQPVQAPQGYPSGQVQQGYPAGQPQQGYQTPQVSGRQPKAGQYQDTNAGQNMNSAAYMNPYAYQGYPQTTGNQPYIPYGGQMPGPQTQQPAGNVQGYPYPGAQVPGASYIPQTPYGQGPAAQGNQPMQGYSQGYSAYGQMGRNQQPQMNPFQEQNGQVPLNGGGYVPPPVNVRRRPFQVTDADLLILSAILLILFALGTFIPGMAFLKWIFLLLAAGSITMLWLKPLVANNKRLCYTIVFGLLAVVTMITFVLPLITGNGANTPGSPGETDPTRVSSQRQAEPGNEPSIDTTAVPAAAVTGTPEPSDDSEVLNRLETFFYYWNANRQDDMLTLCSPTWQSKVDNPKTALFGLMANRTPKNYSVENITGTSNDTSRTVMVNSEMDRNNGKEPVRYRLSVIMVRENDNQWYVDPQSLQTYEAADTPDPSITATPAPTDAPEIYPNTVLYYNPSGGEYYHLDQNCKRINQRYLPLQGHFTYAELGKPPYDKLKPCNICSAPSRDQ